MIRLNLRRILRQRGLLIQDVHEATGISRSTLHRICAKEPPARVDLATLDAICTYLDLPLTDLIQREDDTTPLSDA